MSIPNVSRKYDSAHSSLTSFQSSTFDYLSFHHVGNVICQGDMLCSNEKDPCLTYLCDNGKQTMWWTDGTVIQNLLKSASIDFRVCRFPCPSISVSINFRVRWFPCPSISMSVDFHIRRFLSPLISKSIDPLESFDPDHEYVLLLRL